MTQEQMDRLRVEAAVRAFMTAEGRAVEAAYVEELARLRNRELEREREVLPCQAA